MISFGTASWRRSLYFVFDLFPLNPGSLSPFLDQLDVLGILEPLSEGLFYNCLGLQAMFLTVLVQLRLKFIINPVGNRHHYKEQCK